MSWVLVYRQVYVPATGTSETSGWIFLSFGPEGGGNVSVCVPIYTTLDLGYKYSSTQL